jgi:hypothetical protein
MLFRFHVMLLLVLIPDKAFNAGDAKGSELRLADLVLSVESKNEVENNVSRGGRYDDGDLTLQRAGQSNTRTLGDSRWQ